MAQPSFGLLPLGNVAPNKEVLLLGSRPHTFPPQAHLVALLVDVAAFKILRRPTATRCAHLIAGGVEVLEIYEILTAAADQLVWIVTQQRLRARADAEERSPPISDYDQIQRGLEDAAQQRFS